jgi:cathepsin C
MCDTSQLDEKWSVKSHGYLGGYYGAGDESLMMKELRVRGPFVVSFQPKVDFMYYTKGIYSNVSNREITKDGAAS